MVTRRAGMLVRVLVESRIQVCWTLSDGTGSAKLERPGQTRTQARNDDAMMMTRNAARVRVLRLVECLLDPLAKLEDLPVDTVTAWPGPAPSDRIRVRVPASQWAAAPGDTVTVQ